MVVDVAAQGGDVADMDISLRVIDVASSLASMNIGDDMIGPVDMDTEGMAATPETAVMGACQGLDGDVKDTRNPGDLHRLLSIWV